MESLAQVSKRDLYLKADFAGAENDGVKILGAVVNDGGKVFFHAKRGAAAVDIAGQWLEVFALEHCDGFFLDGGSGFFEVKFGARGNYKNIVLLGFGDGDKGFEDLSGIAV